MSRQGRGAALKKLLMEQELEMQKEEQNRSSSPPPPVQQAEISVGRRGLGRGAIFASLMNAATGGSNVATPSPSSISPESPSSPSPSGSGHSSPLSSGRGRGLLLANLSILTKETEEQTSRNISPESRTETSSSGSYHREGKSSGQISPESRSETSTSGSFRSGVKSTGNVSPDTRTATPSSGEGSARPSSPTTSVLSSISEMSIRDTNQPVVMKGSYGKPVEIVCNYIRLSMQPGQGVYLYEVKFIPDIDSNRYRYDMLFQHKDVIGGVRTFDGASLFLPFKLPDVVTELVSKLPSDGSEVLLKIIFKRKSSIGEAGQTLNILFRKIMNHLGFVEMGRHFFDPTAGKPIPAHRLEVWPGFITAIDEYEGGLMLCCDASHRVLRTETCLELMDDLRQVMPHDWKKHFVDLVIGKSVLTRYNNKTYRVDDVLFDQTPMNTFSSRDGSEMTYIDYYRKQYDIKITCKDQPLLVSKKVGRLKGKEMTVLVNLIPELSFITGLTDSMRADMKVMKDVAQHTRISPAQRNFCLNKFIKTVNSNEIARNMLASWGLKMEDAMVSLTGRILPPEDIYFNNSSEPGSLQADWSRASTSNHVLSQVAMNNWMIVYPSREEKTIKEFVGMLKKCSPQFGLAINTPQFVSLSDEKTESYLRSLRQRVKPDVQIVIVILLAARADKYAAIKKLCCIESPIPSQVVLMKTIRRPDRLRSVSQKIALQMNCKLGGTLWSVKIPLKKVMVVGIDTYHDPGKRSPSISAIVVSLNHELTRWYSRTGRQERGQELMDSITVNFLAALTKFNEVNGYLPDQILVFRDGVGDGQLDHCKEYEINQLISSCNVASSTYNPKFLFVVVQKRINTRLFLKTGDKCFDNPPPGSIMDHTVCRRSWFDFFLVSQNVRQGTVSPTHYIVIYNSTTMTPDQIQRFSYKLTHLYYNWPGTIRVPAPCQYAHKLAYLVGESIQKEANELLQDKLFYL